MKFSLTNIGKIAQADIEINGLTVLGGYNDIGKSTVGKTLFAVIKTITDIEQETQEAIVEQIEQELINFSVEIRKITGERFVIPLTNRENVGKYITTIILRIREELRSLQSSSLISSAEEKIKISELSNSLENRIKKISNPEKVESYKKVFNSINYSLFRGDVQSRKPATIKSKISLADDSCKVSALLENGSIVSFLIDGNFPFQDITLVDSPLVLGWISSVDISRSRVRRIFGHYIFDLLNKIRFSLLSDQVDLFRDILNPQRRFIDKIGEIIGGSMHYDQTERDFVFKQGEIIIKSVNVASGIKTFGIIQMLLIGAMIAPNTVLIIDEPEAHLHPEWQLKYAEVLTQLVDMGVYVLVSTHSPYMIEALKHYSEKLQQEKITNFYLGNSGEHGTIFSDVTQNLNPLFKLLSMPMQRLAFED